MLLHNDNGGVGPLYSGEVVSRKSMYERFVTKAGASVVWKLRFHDKLSINKVLILNFQCYKTNKIVPLKEKRH